MQRLIDHLRYGTLYQGDVTRDTLDCLERLESLEKLEVGLEEAMAQFPEEDFLEEALCILRGSRCLKKSGILDAIDQALEELERVQQDVNNAAEYARSVGVTE